MGSANNNLHPTAQVHVSCEHKPSAMAQPYASSPAILAERLSTRAARSQTGGLRTDTRHILEGR